METPTRFVGACFRGSFTLHAGGGVSADIVVLAALLQAAMVLGSSVPLGGRTVSEPFIGDSVIGVTGVALCSFTVTLA